MKTIKHIHQDAYGRWVITLNNHEEIVHANLQKANELASRICGAGAEYSDTAKRICGVPTERSDMEWLVGRSAIPALLRTQV